MRMYGLGSLQVISCADALQVISLSDIFISPLEDMYVRGFPHFLMVY
jgi:hypothetical protein